MILIVAWASIVNVRFGATDDAALTAFLKASAAHNDPAASEVSDDRLFRPFQAYTTKKAWYQVEPSMKILERGGWVVSPESNITPVSYTKDDREITFGPQGQRLTVYVQRIPANIRKLRDNRVLFLETLDSADIGYAPLFGEGLANEALFPFGESQKIYFVSGEYFDSSAHREPLKLTCFGRIDDKVAKLWESELAPLDSQGARADGTLANYLRARKWRMKDVPAVAVSDLQAAKPLAYQSENSGDGGIDLGIVSPDGTRRVSRNWRRFGQTVSLDEEQWLRTH